MPTTYSSILIHLVFSVKGRKQLIQPLWEPNLHRYITQIIQRKGHKLLAINGMPDHIHILIGLKPEMGISELVREVKKASTAFIRESRYNSTFQWQEGYGAFSYSNKDMRNVINYITNQKAHHAKTSFENEYLKILDDYGIEFDMKYIF